MKKKFIGLLSIAAITMPIASVVACNDNNDNKKKLALIVSNRSNLFFQKIYDAAKVEAIKHGYELDVYDSEDDEVRETNNVNIIITKKYAGVLYNPINSVGSKTSAQKLIENKIPIVAIDRGFDDLDVVATVATDNKASAKAEVADAMSFVVSQNPSASSYKIYELQGKSGATAANLRNKGFSEAIATNRKFSLVKSDRSNWDTANALGKTNAMRTSHPNIKLIFAANDNMALGAVKAFEGELSYPVIIGFDGLQSAKTAVNNGKMYATVIQDTTKMAQKAVRAILEKLGFKDFTDIQGSINEKINLNGIIYKNINWPLAKS